jgi:5-methylcytosine-specific restriction protein A
MSRDKARLIATAKEVASVLKQRPGGMRLKIRSPGAAVETNTDGWFAKIGHLGPKKVPVLIWLDRYARHNERNLSACFWSESRSAINEIARHASRTVPVVRVITDKDFEEVNRHSLALCKRMPRSEFDAAIIEHYETDKAHFLSVYGKSNGAAGAGRDEFCTLAVEFIEEVARAQPHAKPADEQRDIYPRCEDRKLVDAHLRRERSGYLATEVKIRDGYRCHVCKMSFAESYGEEIGAAFAEAHHLKPLGKQPAKVITKPEDLITVCANCHRMLHRMAGKPDDVERLIAIVRSRPRSWK